MSTIRIPSFLPSFLTAFFPSVHQSFVQSIALVIEMPPSYGYDSIWTFNRIKLPLSDCSSQRCRLQLRCHPAIILLNRPCNDALPLKLHAGHVLMAADRSSQQQVTDPRNGRRPNCRRIGVYSLLLVGSELSQSLRRRRPRSRVLVYVLHSRCLLPPLLNDRTAIGDERAMRKLTSALW